MYFSARAVPFGFLFPFPPPALFLALLTVLSHPGYADEEPYRFPAGPALKHEGVAYAWSAGATILPVAAGLLLARNGDAPAAAPSLLLLGSLLGPSAGEFYAGSPGLGLSAAALRVVGAGIVVVELMTHISCQDCGSSGASDPWRLGTGAGLFASGVVFSLVDTHFAVRRNNQSVTGRRAALSPLLLPASDGSLAFGIRAGLHL